MQHTASTPVHEDPSGQPEVVALPARLSPTAIDRYRACPRSFYLADVVRVPRDQRPSPLFVQGNAIHHALERFFGIAPDERSTEVLHQALRWAWPQHRTPGAFTSREQEAHYGNAALAMLSGFYDNFDCCAIPVAREQWVSMPLAGGVEVYGKADRIDRAAADQLEVIDYKTGRAQVDEEDLWQDTAARVYALGTEHRYGMAVARVRIIYLSSGTEARWDPEREDLDAARERLEDLIARMRQETAWEPVPSARCRWCPVALHCDARGRVALDELEVGDRDELPF
jgi:RecB family exonuclease